MSLRPVLTKASNRRSVVAFGAVLGFIACFLGGSARAAEGNDVQLWLRAGVQGKVHKRVRLHWDQRLRFYDDVHTLARWINNFQIDYEVLKWLHVTPGYRLIYRPDEDVAERCCGSRIQGDAKAKTKLGKVEPSARIRLQSLFEKEEDPETVFRLRLMTALRVWKRVRPYASVEGFVRVLEAGPPIADKLRLTLGTKFRVRRQGKLRAFYRFEVEGQAGKPLQHIFGLGGTFDVRKKKDKKKKKKDKKKKDKEEQESAPPVLSD